MKHIEYLRLDEIDPAEFVALLNKKKIREHLIEHPMFTVCTVDRWLKEKINIDSNRGCRVRAIAVDDQLAGWCGIQPDDHRYEIAIVIDDDYWGLGPKVFRDVMGWANELGHELVAIHLRHTRPEYRFLRKIAKNVYATELLGDRFTTYELAVR
ncbi:MAG: hypothetical protein KDH88_05420 [Chromatiales bacterium]|nr:hypothetical protein [Chromatiales bacterium]